MKTRRLLQYCQLPDKYTRDILRHLIHSPVHRKYIPKVQPTRCDVTDFFFVLLTVHLSIILVINQLN